MTVSRKRWGRVDAYRRHCDMEYPVSSQGAPPVKRMLSKVERDDDGHITFVDQTVIG